MLKQQVSYHHKERLQEKRYASLRLKSCSYMMSSLCTNHPNIPKKYWWGTPAQLQMWGWVFAKPRVIISFDSRLWTRRKGCSSRNSHHFQRGHLSDLLSKDAHALQPPRAWHLLPPRSAAGFLWMPSMYVFSYRWQVATQEVLLFICDVQLKSQN